MTYYWDYEFIQKLRLIPIFIIVLALIAMFLGDFYGVSNPPSWAAFAAFAYYLNKSRNEFQRLKNNKNLGPKFVLNEKDFFYSKGKGKYEVTIAFKEVESIKFSSFFGIKRVIFYLNESRKIVISNIVDSKDLVYEIEKKI